MHVNFFDYLKEQTATLRKEGLYKQERVISSQQANMIVAEGQSVINLCANNYLGLSNNKELITAAQESLSEFGYGMSSVRFICGTQTVHKKLEKEISDFLGMDDAILYGSCFDANTGLFETLFGEEDAIISDSLNHASIIDGVRLCKAKRLRYENNNMQDLEEKLKEASSARFKLICTDGVFSMDGIIANLKEIVRLGEKYNALVMVDDSHAVGFMGKEGRGTHEFCDVMGKIDIITGTLGKALGGASGGYTAGRKEVIEWLRNRSRPYLFSNTLAPVIAATSLKALDIVKKGHHLREWLQEASALFRDKMTKLGFELVPGHHPIIPVMIGDALLAQKMAELLFKEGIYVIGFSFPVVPKGKARIRTQISAGLTRENILHAVDAFEKVGKILKII